jgi:hypothetical protein
MAQAGDAYVNNLSHISSRQVFALFSDCKLQRMQEEVFLLIVRATIEVK